MTNAIFWFTGLPASGKTTLARALHTHLTASRPGEDIRLYDADTERRDGLLRDLGWSQPDRLSTVTRLARAAAGHTIALVTLVTSTEEERRLAQDLLGARLHLIHTDAPLALCRSRDRHRTVHAYRDNPPADAPELSWTTPSTHRLRLATTHPQAECEAALRAYAERVIKAGSLLREAPGSVPDRPNAVPRVPPPR